MHPKDEDEGFGKTKTLRLLYGGLSLCMMDWTGLDWISTVVVLVQRDDSVLLRQMDDMTALASGSMIRLLLRNQAISVETALLSSRNVIVFWFASQPASSFF